MPKKARPRPIHFETTVPVIRRHVCGVWFAAGVAEGIKAEAEIVPLDLQQKLWCVLNHIEMFALRRSGLIQMDRIRLTDPAFTVLYPQHWCHIQWPRPKQYWPSKPSAGDIPPF